MASNIRSRVGRTTKKSAPDRLGRRRATTALIRDPLDLAADLAVVKIQAREAHRRLAEPSAPPARPEFRSAPTRRMPRSPSTRRRLEPARSPTADGERSVARRREIVRRLDRHVRNRDNSGGERCKGASGRQVRTRRDEIDARRGPELTSSRAFERDHEIGRRLDRRKIANEQQAAANRRVVSRAARTVRTMPLHRVHLDRGQQIVDESDVLVSKLATIHRLQLGCEAIVRSPSRYPDRPGAVPEYSPSRAVPGEPARRTPSTAIVGRSLRPPSQNKQAGPLSAPPVRILRHILSFSRSSAR